MIARPRHATAASRARGAARLARWACALWLVGCRIGGGDGIVDPLAQGSTQLDAGIEGAAGTSGSSGGGGGGGGTSGAAGTSGGAGASGAAGTSSASRDASTADDAAQADAHDASMQGDGALADASANDGACRAPAVAVCDPVANTGCSGVGMQCDVDLLAPTLAGRCAFSSPMDAGLCFASPFTESCPPGETCGATGECRALCFCDTDCPQGECCHEDLGTLGFKLCVPCP